MPDISGILNMGRQALSAHQRAIAVTSNNIANVNTPGYSRQKISYETAPALNGVFGAGVQIAQVRSVVDTFLQRQIISGQSSLGRFAAEKSALDRVEAIFSDADSGINTAIGDFFSAVNDLSTNPSGTVERTVLLERGRSLSQAIRSADTQLKSISKDVDSEIRGRVDEVNGLASKIADLNKQISLVENSGDRNVANDLRDDRTRLLGELSEKIQVNLLETQASELTITVGSGGRTVALVSGDIAYSLSTAVDENNSGFAKILSRDGTDITRSIPDGRLRGLIELRDNLLPAYTNQLDKLAASIVTAFNTQHAKGFALNGSTGIDFFSSLTLAVNDSGTNTGGATVVATIGDASVLTFDSYEITFSQDQFTMRNLKTGAETTEFTETDFGFTALFEGISIEIAGDASEGDRFDIQIPYQGMAGKMDVSLADSSLVAAASSAEELPGGNGNAVLLAQIQDQAFSFLNATFQGFYANFTGEVGTRSETSQRNLSVEEVISGKLDALREEVSGVSLDEEMTNLISFQRAYQASAKLITTADELLQTVIEMKR